MNPRVKKIKVLALSIFVGVILLANGVSVVAAGGDLDTSFEPGTGANNTVRATALQADGKIIIAGNFTTYNGVSRNRIARINADGSLDTSFDPGTGTNNRVIWATALQSDGKIIIGGAFTSYNGTSRNYIARLNSNGSLDTSFDPGAGANGPVNSIALQPDSKVIISGSFTTYNGNPIKFIARLNPDGSLDTSFDPGTSTDSVVYTTALQSDGKIIIGGYFTNFNGVTRNYVARLNSNGSLDTSFNPVTTPLIPGVGGSDSALYSIAVQPDGKIILGGDAFIDDGTSIKIYHLVRLNSDGSLDTTFDTGTGPNDFVYAIVVQPDGKIIIGGLFNSYNSTPRIGITRINSNGSLDASFDTGTGVNAAVFALALQANGKIIIGGEFINYNGTSCIRVARLQPAPGALSFSAANYSVNEGGGAAALTLTRTGGTDNKVVAKVSLTDGTTTPADYRFSPGAVDTAFNSVPGFTSATGTNSSVGATALQPDGKIVIGGPFTICRGVARNHIARLNADGTLDTTFDPGEGTNGPVSSITVQADGKIIISGFFFNYNGTPLKYIARLKPDGSLDTTFNPGPIMSSPVSVALQADGKILLAGDFSDSSVSHLCLTRLNPDGSLDATFNQGTGANNSLVVQALQPDGKIIVSGDFTSYNGDPHNHILRLNSDGSVDTTFNPIVDARDHFASIILLPDGKIIVGGDITDVNGIHGLIMRLNSDGSLDASFNPGTGPNLSIYTMALQPDGKIIIAGNFTTYHGVSRNRMARLNSDGSLDTTFNPGLGANNPVVTMKVQENGKIIIGGDFTDYNNAYRSHIARVEGDIFVTWPAGDAANKTVQLPIVDDSILEPNETLTLSLTPLTGDATAGTNPTTTLTIVDNDTSVSTVSGSGVYNGTATLTATLASFSSRLSGKTVSFALFGTIVGTATTDSNGVATLNSVNIPGGNAGTYANAVTATFTGDTNYSSSSNTGTLTVSKATPIITWSSPSAIAVGTALSNSQLNATANVPGTFQYNPPASTVFNTAGNYQLSVSFTPNDTVNYNTATASVQLTVVDSPMISFSSSTYNVDEGAGHVNATVTRTDSTGAATVTYATSDPAGLQNCNVVNGIASSRCDYATSVGTVRFAAGETSRTISIPIVADNFSEGIESFTLTLSNPVGATLGSISTSTITITDNASTGGNPLDSVPFFVRQHYIDFLGREPDSFGFKGWQAMLNNCAAGDITCDRIEVSSRFFRSAEFQERGYFVYRFYSASFGRKPNYEEFIPDVAKVSGFLTEAEKEANKVAFADEFVQRAEFKAKYDAQVSPTAYVNALIAASGLATHPSHDGWIAGLTNGSLSRAQVLRQLAESSELSQKYSTEAFVVMQYFGYLRRNPDKFYLDWIVIMNQDPANYRNMVNGFMNSTEYRNRFAQ